MLELICQIAIPIFSGLGVFFVSRNDDTKRFGYIFGLCSQPFWIYTLYTHRQWGLFGLSIFFTIQWIKGIRNYWFPKTPVGLMRRIIKEGKLKDWLRRHQWWCIFWQKLNQREPNDYDGVCLHCKKDRVTGKVAK